MSEDDRLREEDLDATHAVVRRMYHRSMTAAVLGGLFFAVVCALAMYFVPATRSIGAAVVVGVLTWLFFGVPLALSWWLHYRSPFQQLAQLRRRILAGEAVCASEVNFRRES